MGYYKEGSMTHFEPDDDENTLHIRSEFAGLTLEDLLERAQKKWGPDIKLENIGISSEKIHTRCIFYDCYDSGDYENFIILTKEN